MHRFPDRVVLQGFFHPREKADVLYTWVAGCLVEGLASMTTYSFELYTTPPRRVLDSPVAVAKKRRTSTDEISSTFADLSLVPAAIVYVAWKSSFKGRFYW